MDAGLATRQMLLRRGLTLEYATLSWNVVAVPILLITAAGAGSVAFAGYGVDSLIEIIASAVVVWQLKGEQGSRRERLALRIIAVAFVALAIYIDVQTAIILSSRTHPGHSTLGIVWLALTVAGMLALAAGKRDTGRRLGNRVLQTESRVTLIDGALSAAVLAGVVLNAVLGWWWATPFRDADGSMERPTPTVALGEWRRKLSKRCRNSRGLSGRGSPARIWLVV
jgi:divalent metal cation (Fe/Co/Zn/Cd) transporter